MLIDLVIPGLLILMAAVWYDSMAARERANAAAQEVCVRKDLDLLDGTVALAEIRLVRQSRGYLCLRRTYTFDYCEDGFSRSSGFVILRGRQIEATGLDAGGQGRTG